MLTRIHTMVAIRVNELKDRNEKGASAVEYGLLVALIAAVIIGAVVILGNLIEGAFDGVNDTLGANGVVNAD